MDPTTIDAANHTSIDAANDTTTTEDAANLPELSATTTVPPSPRDPVIQLNKKTRPSPHNIV